MRQLGDGVLRGLWARSTQAEDTGFTDRGHGVGRFVTDPSGTGSGRGLFSDCLCTAYVVGGKGSADQQGPGLNAGPSLEPGGTALANAITTHLGIEWSLPCKPVM